MNAASARVRRTPGPAARPYDEGRALALLREGRTATEVCAMLHVRKERIVALGRAAGIPLEWGRKRKAFNRERALELLHDGMPPYKVAVAVSAPKPAVYALAKELVRRADDAKREPRRAAWRRFYRKHAGAMEAKRASWARTPDDAANAPCFVCAKCGREFRIGSSGETVAQGYTLLGGRKWCSECAQKRFRRRIDWDAPESTNAVRPGLEAWK